MIKKRKMINSVIAVIAVLFIVFVSVPVVSYAADSSDWDNAQYIDQSFKSHLLSEDCIFDDSVFGTNSVGSYAYNNVKSSIDNAADPMSHPFYNRFLNCDATNLFDGSLYGYIKWSSSSDDKYPFRIGYYSENEIVMTISNNNGERCRLYSKTELIYETWNWSSDYYSINNVNDKPTGTSNQSYGYTSSSSVLSDTTFTYYSVSGGNIGSSSQQIYLYNAPFKIFDTVEHAVTYLYTGDETGLLYSPAPPVSYDSGLYLENFKMTVHDSNDFDKYYVSFSYSIPDVVKQNYDISHVQLEIENTLQYEAEVTEDSTVAVFNFDSSHYNTSENTGYDYIPLYDHQFGFTMYLGDFSSVNNFLYGGLIAFDDNDRRTLLGGRKSFQLDTFGLAIDDFGISFDFDNVEVLISRLDIGIRLVSGSVNGYVFDSRIDLLDSDNSWYESYVPDDSGSYTSNNDKQYNDGYYYTDVGTDSAGNPTYNYYYYDSSGGRSQVDSSGQPIVIDNSTGNITQTVNVPDTINVNLHNTDSSGAGGGITIEDDDFSFSSISSILKSGFGLIDDVDTDVKGDGYVDSMKYLYGYLPEDFSNLPVFGICSVVAIAIIRAVLKR